VPVPPYYRGAKAESQDNASGCCMSVCIVLYGYLCVGFLVTLCCSSKAGAVHYFPAVFSGDGGGDGSSSSSSSSLQQAATRVLVLPRKPPVFDIFLYACTPDEPPHPTSARLSAVAHAAGRSGGRFAEIFPEFLGLSIQRQLKGEPYDRCCCLM
jgi:hypothetical protein